MFLLLINTPHGKNSAKQNKVVMPVLIDYIDRDSRASIFLDYLKKRGNDCCP